MNSEQYQEYLKSEAWKVRRAWKLDEADYRCQLCYLAGDLQVHHRTYERAGKERQNDLIVLCGDCHAKFHDRLPVPAPEPPRVRTKVEIWARQFVDWWELNLAEFPPPTPELFVEKMWFWLGQRAATKDERGELLEASLRELRERGLSINEGSPA